jgi:hypothetical protein
MRAAPVILTRSSAAWDGPAFRATLIGELQALGPEHPALHPILQAALTRTSAVADSPLAVHLLGSHAHGGQIQARVGIFFAGIIAGCSCADDPSPVDGITEHCELQVTIDRATGRARFAPADT